MNEAGFKGKTAIVTGSATGIGAAAARRLGREGANIVVNFATREAEVRTTVAAFGAVDIVVNNAFRMVRAVIALLKESGHGTIVNISSIAYAASKGARNAMTRSLVRIATPEDIAEVVIFFTGSESRHVKDETYLVDANCT